MTGPTQLALWRDSRELTVATAARLLRISPETYERLEAGEGECPPSLALDIFERTGGAVLPHELPGCAIDTVSDGARTAPPAASSDEGGASGVAPPSNQTLGADLAVLDGADGGSRWSCFLERHGNAHVVSIVRAGNGGGSLAKLTPGHAAELGIELTRAAMLAILPGSVPI